MSGYISPYHELFPHSKDEELGTNPTPAVGQLVLDGLR